MSTLITQLFHLECHALVTKRERMFLDLWRVFFLLMFEIKLENTQSEYRLLVFSWEIQHVTVKKMRQKKKIVREIQTSRLINTACSLMLTFQAQTFIFPSNISCQLHLGRSHFLSSPPSSNLVSSSSNPLHLFIYLILLLSPFLSSPPLFLLPSAFPLLYFFLSTFHHFTC